MKQKWRFIHPIDADGYFQMALDEVLFEAHRQGQPHVYPGILRFYEFAVPTATMGVFQKISDVPASIRDADYDLVRRLTAGGLVCHEHSLTFSLTASRHYFLKAGESREMLYPKIHAIIEEAFGQLGVSLEMECSENSKAKEVFFQICFKQPVRYDLMRQGKKMVGGAQKHVRDIFLHQGDIHLAGVPGAEKAGFKIDLMNKITGCFRQKLDVSFSETNLTVEEERAAADLAENKYRSHEWIMRR